MEAQQSWPIFQPLPERSCFIRPLLVLGSMGRKSLYQVISGSGFPLAAHSMVAVRVRSTTLSWGPMSMLGKPGGSRSSAEARAKGLNYHLWQLLFRCSIKWAKMRRNTRVFEPPSYSEPDVSFPTKVKWGLSVHMCSELLYPGRSS